MALDMLHLFNQYRVDEMPGNERERELIGQAPLDFTKIDVGSDWPYYGDDRLYGWNKGGDYNSPYGLLEIEGNDLNGLHYTHFYDDYYDDPYNQNSVIRKAEKDDTLKKVGAYTDAISRKRFSAPYEDVDYTPIADLSTEDVVLTAARDPDPRKRRMAGLAIAAALGLTTGAVGTKLMSGDKDDQRP